jgi:hypothetical protein
VRPYITKSNPGNPIMVKPPELPIINGRNPPRQKITPRRRMNMPEDRTWVLAVEMTF